MAFKIALTPTYTTLIKVVMPNDKGSNDTSEFKVEFKRKKVNELEVLKTVKTIEVLRDNIVSFSGLLDENNKEVDFNEVNLEILLHIPQVLKALSDAFWETQFGAREKN